MHCIDPIVPTRPSSTSRRPGHRSWRRARWLCLAGVLALQACGSSSPSSSSSSVSETTSSPASGRVGERGLVTLPEPAPVHSADGLRLQAARRIVQANPSGTYSGPTPQVLLAVPVLEVELNADGSIRRIEVMRRPSQAPETTQMAIDAVRRAAPFGDVSRLPRPRKFIETFLFDDEKRFKPRTLDR